MDSLLIILIAVLILLNIGVLLFLLKNKQEKTENPLNHLKTSLMPSKSLLANLLATCPKILQKICQGL